jgi:hypothetical protein
VAELLERRMKGPLDKLHNILDYIRKTPQRLDRFAMLVKEIDPTETVFTIRVGNITRWPSDDEAIKRAFSLRGAIQHFARGAIRLNQDGERDAPLHGLQHDELMPEDLEFVGCVMEIFEPFKPWTNRLQGKYSNGFVAEILPAMEELLSDLEQAKLFYQAEGHSGHLITMVNHGWDVLNKYYGLTDDCPAYIVALALDPTMTLAWFHINWEGKPDWMQGAQPTVNDIWSTSYRGQNVGGK